MCFGCSKEPSHRDGSFEYPQHMFWLRNKKNNFQLRSLIWGPEYSTFDIHFLALIPYLDSANSVDSDQLASVEAR